MNQHDLERQLPGLERLRLVSRRPGRSHLPGLRRGLARGSSVEFADYRRYNPGDDIRHIDWNIFARSRQLFLRQFRAETELEVHLLVDCSASMGVGRGGKLDCAKRLATMLAYVGISNFDRVGLTTFNDRPVRHLPPERGRCRLFELCSQLDRTVAEGVTDFEPAFERFGDQARHGGLAILLSDLLGTEDIAKGLDSLAHRNLDVVVVQILSRQDLEPDLDGWIELRDAEDDSLPPLRANEAAREGYTAALTAHNDAVAAHCRRRGIRYLSTASSASNSDLTSALLAAGIWQRK